MIKIEFSGNRLVINSDSVVNLSYPIRDAFELSGIVIVFLDPDANLGREGQYRNLLGFDRNGRKLWEAELPTANQSDVYWRIKEQFPLIASSFSSYECRIDEETGKIKSSVYYK